MIRSTRAREIRPGWSAPPIDLDVKSETIGGSLTADRLVLESHRSSL